jgi:predicted amidophosphoribosyltransferase
MSDIVFGIDRELDHFCPRCGMALTKADASCLRCYNKKPKRQTIKKYSGKSNSVNKFNNYQ